MRQRPTLEPLEPRILFSADTPSALAAALVGTPDAEHRLLDAEGEFAVQNEPAEIVFIDARTPDAAQLVEDIAAQSGRQIEVVVLDAERNGLEQINEALAGRENVAALHFIAHGGEGIMQLGNTLVTADALERNPSVVEAWSKALSADADILLYGCDIAATAQGRLLADTLARLTGADVSASDDATGHASLGGDWNLEYQTGAIDVAVAPTASAQEGWSHLLPSVVVTSYEPDFNDLNDNDFEIAGGTTYAQSFSHVSGAGTYTVNQIDLVLYRNAVTNGADVDIELRDGLGGGSNLLASGSASRAELSMTENWVVVSLSTTATLTDGTTYYVVIKGTGGGDIFVGIDDAGAYPDGNLTIDSNPELAKDMAFRVVSSDGPVVDLNGGAKGQDTTAAFTEQTPVLIAKNATIADPNSLNLTSLTVTLTARPDGDTVESLSATVTGGLTVNYDQATGVLSITGSASIATYQTILQGIQYNNTSDAPTTTNRVVSVVATDDGGTPTPSAARISVITVTTLVNDAPVNTVPGAQTTNEDTTLVFSAGNGNAISITDDAGTNPVRVALTVTNGVLTLAGTGGLTFTLGDGTADGAMTFTGTVAAINAALNGMSFLPSAEFSGAALLTIITNDLGNTSTAPSLPLSDTDIVAITVNAVNDPPVIAGAGGTLAVTEGGAAALIDATLTLSDVDDVNIESATVTISVGLVSAEDVLSFSSNFGITGIYTAATGVLALSGSATLAQYEQVLESVTYQNTNTNDPSTGARTVTWVVNDGTDNSAGVTSTVTLAAINDAPVNAVPGAQSVNEDAALVFSAGNGNAISIADVDAGASPVQVTLSGTNGVITLAGTAGLSFSAGDGSADGTMTFTGTVAAINAALDGLSFAPSANFNGAASLSINTSDQGNTGSGGSLSDLDAVAITVNAVNDAPVLAPAAPSFTSVSEDQTANVGDSVAALLGASVSDVDAGALEGIAVTGLVSSNGTWEFSTDGGLSWNAVGAVADNNALLLRDVDRLRFVPDGLDADAGSVSYRAWDRTSGTQGTKVDASVNGGSTAFSTASDSASITVMAVNDGPVNTVPGAQATNEDTALVFSGGNAISIADVDAGASSVQVTLSGTNGVITLAGTAGLSFSAGDGTADGTMTFTGTVAAINAALNGLSFAPTANFNGAASLSINTNDQGNAGAGGALSDSDTVAITVAALNDAPVNTVPGAQATNEDTALVFSTGNGNAISVGDVDAGTSPVQVVLTGANGAITLAGIAGLTFSVGDGVADATMTFSGTMGAINAALNGLSFAPTANFNGAASLSINTSDQGNTGSGGALSDVDAVAITVLPNVAPTVSASGGTTAFTEGANVASTPVVLDGAVTVSDPDSTTLAGATISIGAGWQAAEDVLGFAGNPATMGNIAGGYNAATGVLSLSSAGATATLAEWQAALRTVVYTNTSDTPNTAMRTVNFVVSGQGGSSTASAQQVAVIAANDAPTLSASGGSTAFTGGGAAVAVDTALAVVDVDNATLAAAIVSISGGFQPGQDVLQFSNDPATMGNIAGSYDPASGVLDLNSAGATATLAQWQAALRSVSYGNTAATPIIGARAVSLAVSDGSTFGPGASHLVIVNPAPVVPEPPAPPPVVPPPVIPPVVGPPPVTPPPTPAPQPAPTAAPGRPAGAAASEGSAELPTQPVSVDIAERPHNPTASVSASSDAGTAPALRLASYGVAVLSADPVSGDLLAEVARQSETRAANLFQSGEKGRSAGEEGLAGELESLRENLREQDEIQQRGTVVLAAGSLSMTLAYLLWLIRGGALVASALSALPAWRILDPLPVLSRVDDEDEDEADEEEDQAIASFADEPVSARP